MRLITLDFETYYTDSDLGFKKQTTEEYVRDPRFEVIGVSVQVEDGEPVWFSGPREQLRKHLKQFNWKESAVLAHNMLFDGAILSWIFNIKPMVLMDTLCMARAIHGVEVGGSLAALTERYELGKKGDEVVKAINKTRADFTPEDLALYGEYCKNDVRLTYKLFLCMLPNFDQDELKLIDMTLRMFTDPMLYVDQDTLRERFDDLVQEKTTLLTSLMSDLECSTEEEVREKISSNPKFAKVLEKFNIPVPMKMSEKQKKEIPALAKKDEGFIALTEHEDSFVQHLCAVRLGTKSTLEEKRLERFMAIGVRNKGRLPIPLKYYGAHTGRWSGTDKVNFQNLPSRDVKKKALKKAIVPPEGYKVINSDSSQIEARVLVWLAGQDDVVKQFADGEDVYSVFATKIYGVPISKANPIERFVGKTCIAEGTLVLSDSGWKPIELVTTADKLWDGEEWVCHQGLVNNGIKPTLNLCGAWLTPDHQVWSGTQWLEAQLVVADENILYQVLDTAVGNLPLQATFADRGEALLRLSSNVTVDLTSTAWTTITSKISKARAVRFVPKLLQTSNGTGCIRTQWLTTDTEPDFSIDWLLPSQDATPQQTKHTLIMGGVAYRYGPNGEKIEPPFFSMYKRLKVGMSRVLKWTGLMSTAVTSLTISNLCPEVTTLKTSAKSQTLRPVFDILNCGSRNRFTILTEAGPVIVHNCILGLGYGTGKLKLQHTLKTTPPGITVTEDEAKSYVDIYRTTNDKVIQLWNDGDSMLSAMMNGNIKKPIQFGEHGCVFYDNDGIILPNGLRIHYANLRRIEKDGKSQVVYDSRRGEVSIWGGTVVENVVQALARIVVGKQMIAIAERHRVALTVHDAAVVVVEDDDVDEAVKYITEVMHTPPDWATGLPVACEAKVGATYGDC